MKLKGKVIVITGASQGLGKVLAQKAAVEGAQVILVARSENLLKKVCSEIITSGGLAKYFVCDIRKLSDIQSTVIQILAEFKNIDILVNNAGIWTDNEIEMNNPERRDLAFETNALGNIHFTYEVLPHFKSKDSGYIFNIISVSGTSDSPAGNNRDWQTYGATKWAMTGFTQALQSELTDSGIKVTGFFPGGFDSNIFENAKMEDAHNQPWMMKTEDVADVALFALTQPDDVLVEKIVITKKFKHYGKEAV